MDLDIHPASEDERLAAYRNVYDVWPQAETLEEHVQRRLASVQHSRAEWFVGCVDGRVAASLACYPLEFWRNGTTIPGMAIGSVHTLANYRGRGFAPQLIRWVEEYKRLTGVQLSVLYSDIDPDYYARLGYLRCPSHVGWADPREAVPRDCVETFLGSIDGSFESIRECLASGGGKLVINRSPEYWGHLQRKQPVGSYFILGETLGGRVRWVDNDGSLCVGDECATNGYVWTNAPQSHATSCKVWKLADFAVKEDDDERLDDLFGHVMQLAAEGGAERIGGWMPDMPVTRKWFDVQPRTKEITMLKLLDDSLELTDADIAATDWFCEIDHV